MVPWVEHGPGASGMRTRGNAQVLAHRLPRDRRARGQHPRDDRGVAARDETLQDPRAAHHRHTGYGRVVLDRHDARTPRTIGPNDVMSPSDRPRPYRAATFASCDWSGGSTGIF